MGIAMLWLNRFSKRAVLYFKKLKEKFLTEQMKDEKIL